MLQQQKKFFFKNSDFLIIINKWMSFPCSAPSKMHRYCFFFYRALIFLFLIDKYNRNPNRAVLIQAYSIRPWLQSPTAFVSRIHGRKHNWWQLDKIRTLETYQFWIKLYTTLNGPVIFIAKNSKANYACHCMLLRVNRNDLCRPVRSPKYPQHPNSQFNLHKESSFFTACINSVWQDWEISLLLLFSSFCP